MGVLMCKVHVKNPSAFPPESLSCGFPVRILVWSPSYVCMCVGLSTSGKVIKKLKRIWYSVFSFVLLSLDLFLLLTAVCIDGVDGTSRLALLPAVNERDVGTRPDCIQLRAVLVQFHAHVLGTEWHLHPANLQWGRSKGIGQSAWLNAESVMTGHNVSALYDCYTI